MPFYHKLGTIPHKRHVQFRRPDGSVAVYFEAAAVITVLVLLGQVLELRAREQTSGAIRQVPVVIDDPASEIVSPHRVMPAAYKPRHDFGQIDAVQQRRRQERRHGVAAGLVQQVGDGGRGIDDMLSHRIRASPPGAVQRSIRP